MAMAATATTNKLANFPAELRALRQWVVWKYETRGDKRTKVPYCPRTHRRASSTSSSTWSDYTTAVGVLSTHSYTGVGFVFAPPHVGIDLDHCRDASTGAVEPWAAAIIGELNSYTEISPSGTGLHSIVNSTIPPGGNRRGRCEMYSAGRYFTVTGDHLAGTPLTVEARDLTALHARMLGNTLEAIPAAAGKVIPFERHDKPSRDDLMAGNWAGHKSESEAEFALCLLLAEECAGDAEKIDAAVRASGLYRAKWNERRGNTTYGAQTIENALKLWREKGAICIVEDEEDAPVSTIPIYPPEALTGDYIGDLTSILTDGTSVPPQFVRENIKCILGSIIDGHVGYVGQERLHVKHWLTNISVHQRTGKGVSWEMTGHDETGLLYGLLVKCGVRVVDGGLFGSGEFMVKRLRDLEANGTPSHVLARFDEMVDAFNKGKTTGSTWQSKLLQLYERTSLATGSFKNGEYDLKDTHLSFSGDFTAASFQSSFEGSGAHGSGFLARCTFTYSDRMRHKQDWRPTENIAAIKTLAELELATDTVLHAGSGKNVPDAKYRLIPNETDEARDLRWNYFESLRNGDPRYTPELEAHCKRDLIMRAVYSKDMQIDANRMRRSIAWTEHQLELRRELWPEDAGGTVERMERVILKVLGGRAACRSQG